MTSTPAPGSTLNRGKLAVAGMIAVALGLAAFAWAWNWQRTQKCREFYGGEGANLVRTAEKVEGLVLSGYYDAESVEQIEVGPHAFEVALRRDLSKAPGLIHARTALLDDHSYQWTDQTTGDCQPVILYAARFSRGQERITLAFDFGCRRVWIVESQKQATMAPKISDGWKAFLDKHMQVEGTPPDEE